MKLIIMVIGFIVAIGFFIFLEFYIKKPIFRLIFICLVFFITISYSINYGASLKKGLSLRIYSMGFQRVFSTLCDLSKTEQYDLLNKQLQILRKEMPLAIYDRTQFTDLIDNMQEVKIEEEKAEEEKTGVR